MGATESSPVATILSYHQVGKPSYKTIPRRGSPDVTSEELRYTVPRSEFKAELDSIEDQGFHVIPLSDLVGYIKGQRDSLPPKSVVITVDDGWLSSYTEIFPELRRRGMPFTLFIYPDIIGKGKGYVTWAEVVEMANHGVDIESHTFTHSFLTRRNNGAAGAADYAKFLEHELLDSKREIERHTGRPVRFLAYPYSDYDGDVENAVIRFEYEAALYDRDNGTFVSRVTSLMHLKRFPVLHDTTLTQFRSFLLP